MGSKYQNGITFLYGLSFKFYHCRWICSSYNLRVVLYETEASFYYLTTYVSMHTHTRLLLLIVICFHLQSQGHLDYLLDWFTLPIGFYVMTKCNDRCNDKTVFCRYCVNHNAKINYPNMTWYAIYTCLSIHIVYSTDKSTLFWHSRYIY